MCMLAGFDPEDDVETIVASNVSPPTVISPPDTIDFSHAAMPAATQVAIADSGAVQIFIMEGTPVKNKRPTDCPLKVALADGRRVMSTHICDVDIPGLPVVLTGHIIPELSIASLFGIRVLTDVGCMVTFDIDKCFVTFNGNEILRGYKDTTTDLWNLPLGGDQRMPAHQHDVVMSLVACPKIATARTWSPPNADGPTHVATFAHTVRTKANSIKYAHQSFCSPRLSTFLKAIQRGFLKGCPNLTSTGVTKYLNPSPASSKGHMKRPHQGIRSTRPRKPPKRPLKGCPSRYCWLRQTIPNPQMPTSSRTTTHHPPETCSASARLPTNRLA